MCSSNQALARGFCPEALQVSKPQPVTRRNCSTSNSFWLFGRNEPLASAVHPPATSCTPAKQLSHRVREIGCPICDCDKWMHIMILRSTSQSKLLILCGTETRNNEMKASSQHLHLMPQPLPSHSHSGVNATCRVQSTRPQLGLGGVAPAVTVST